MPLNPTKDPDYEPVLQALLEKTRAGKLAWKETADEDTFVATVKGEQSFEIILEPNPEGPTHVTVDGRTIVPRIPVLRVKDGAGKLLFETPKSMYVAVLTSELYGLARRIASRIDDKIEQTVELLNKL
jgi:hypothetical protein